MKKYLYRSILLACCLLMQHSVLLAQAAPCPIVVPIGSPTVAGTSGVTLPCGVSCATLTATAPVTVNETSTYTVSSITFSPFSFTSGTNATSGATALTSFDDQFGNAVPLGFTFCYFGTAYTQVAIGTNGNISFNTTGATSVVNAYDPWSISGPLPGASTGSLNAVRNCIMAPWQDLLPTGGGTIRYQTYGTAPCRKFVVSWDNVKLFVSAPAGTESTYQIVLHESTNIIDIFIQKRVPYTGWNSGRAVTGIANNVPAAPITAFYTAPGENGTTFSATNEGWRFAPAGTPGTWSYTWTSSTGTAGTGATVVVCPTITTTYTVTATTSACAGVTVSDTIRVNLDGYVFPITGTTTLCSGTTSTLTSASTGGTWSSSNPSVATVSATGVLTGVSAGTATITYDIGGGCYTTAPVTIYPTPGPILGLGTVCMPGTVTLSNIATGGFWTSSDPSVASIGGGTGIVLGVSAGSATITYSTGAGLCSITAPFTVYATEPITGLAGVCQYFTDTLDNTLPGTWSSSNPSIATIDTGGVVRGLTAGTVNITYTSTEGCIMTRVVTVHPKPVPPPVTSPSSYCQFQIPVPMAATGTGLLWYGTGITPAMTIAPTPVTNVPGVDTYYVTQTSGFGCVSDSTTTLVTVKPKPEPPATFDTMYCQYFSSPAPLNAVGTGLRWYNASGVTLGTVAPVPPTNFVGTTTWYVDQTVSGCVSDKAPVNVTIIFKPEFEIVASGLKVCQFDTLTFAYSGPAMVGAGYLWDLPVGAVIVRGSIYDSMITVRFDTARGKHILNLSASNLNGMCFTTKSIEVKVIPQPGTHAYIKPDICLGDTISLALTDRTANASDFLWMVDDTLLANSTITRVITKNSNTGGPMLISILAPGMHIIKVQTFADGMCPSRIMSDSLRVHELPTATFKIVNIGKKICLEDSVEFEADSIKYNNTYTWGPEHAFRNENKARIWGRMEHERTNVTLTVTTPFGCKAIGDMELQPETCCKVFVPTAFSPNGDGKNDVFKPVFSGYHRFHIFRITNRWGQTIFQSTSNDSYWDGTYNGEPQDLGVYFYYLKYDCGGKTLEEKGDVTLVR